MTLEEAIEYAQMLGYRVNNLFEKQAGGWQANVHRGKDSFEFGHAETPVDALKVALAKAGFKL